MSNTLDDADLAVLQQNTEMLKYDTILYISNSSFGITDHRSQIIILIMIYRNHKHIRILN